MVGEKAKIDLLVTDSTGGRSGSQRRKDDWMVGSFIRKARPLDYIRLVQEARAAALEETATKLGITQNA